MREAATDGLLGEIDLHLFNEGKHACAHEKLGAHLTEHSGKKGARFAVWAPNAKRVGVIGDFNQWGEPAQLERMGGSGIWQGFIAGVQQGESYKYRVESTVGGYSVDKADPFAAYSELAPGTASRVWQPEHDWGDQDWMAKRADVQGHGKPVSIYEVHLGSWMRVPGEDRFLTYRELAPLLAEHAKATGFTHVELMPIMEHPFYGSWGYQVTGYFAPTARYGTPEDFMYFMDTLHQAGIGVIVDWVPAHFPSDEHALIYFDGTHLFEHADPRQGIHPEWGSAIYNYGRNEVRSFLMSSANVWLDRYHVDGLRVDAVASMLYLDYARKAGEWIPNRYGGNENLEAVDFLKDTNTELYREHPDVLLIAEESTAWPGVSRPVYTGGLGFGFKWDMGWMHDSLAYFEKDPIYRSYNHHQLTFRAVYAFTESFVLALSHDEVVHGKGSLLNKMPGDDWQKFANLRLLYTLMWSQPGKKLMFMGCEFGQREEWKHDGSLDWHLTQVPGLHAQLQMFVGELNRLYRELPALHQGDHHPEGFVWVSAGDSTNSVYCYLRQAMGAPPVLVILNATPVVRHGYRVGVPQGGRWQEAMNSDAESFGGSGQGNAGSAEASAIESHGFSHSLDLTLPPLGALFLQPSE